MTSDSPLETFGDLVAAYESEPRSVAIGGGSVPGGMDHLVAAMAMEAAGKDPTQVKYIPYDAGGKAMAALLSGEIDALSTGFSEAVAMATARVRCQDHRCDLGRAGRRLRRRARRSRSRASTWSS